jgi:chemotaxis protein CheD
MGEMVASRTADDVLTVVGLGSCVALVLCCPERGAAALAHVVLPDSDMTRGREAPPAKFANTAVPALVSALRRYRVKPDQLTAYLVGGSSMFGLSPKSKLAGVGDRNVEAVKRELKLLGIPVAGEDVGGEHGRSIQVNVGECRVMSKSGTEELIDVGPSKSSKFQTRNGKTTEQAASDALAAASAFADSVNGRLIA